MEKLKKENINPEVFDLYDDYAHDKIGRLCIGRFTIM
jgi:hypothetical protein